MGRRISIVATACCLALAIVASSRAAEKLVLYTSVREPLLGAVCEAFAKAYPDVELNVLSAGAGRLTEKIREQRGNGKIVADVLWSTGIPAFFQFQGEGVLKPYSAPSHGGRIDPFAGEGRGFTAVFFEALGVLYNPRLVKKPPRTWEDVLDKEYTGVFGIADPMVSGTAFIGISLLVKQYGWDFLQKMLANKAKIGKSASLVAQDVAEGELVAGMAVDYMALGKIKRDGTLACVFPRNYLVTPSAVGIMAGSPNLPAAQKFVDFILSRTGQGIIAACGTFPARKDIQLHPMLPTASLQEAFEHAVMIDYAALADEKKALTERYMGLLRANNVGF